MISRRRIRNIEDIGGGKNRKKSLEIYSSTGILLMGNQRPQSEGAGNWKRAGPESGVVRVLMKESLRHGSRTVKGA